ncbi:phosphopyruvate hydratase [Candidatus Woesearchaeota archaeon]|nr:phosphopyruvate hydratase [Candidatus Woesearchaeota archaeon]|tara:strand:- start:19999 stop:21264 length:1266 start_codon:yes stop_codon:yes gene_type:complete
MDFKIKKIIAREILDSRGNPTVECDVYAGSIFGRAEVPSGASTGKFEAVELRDGGRRYGGLGVRTAVNNINETISKRLVGKDCKNQQEIDKIMIELDGTENKSVLGANAILAVSLAVARAAASASNKSLYRYLAFDVIKNKKLRLPIPFSNVINGGRHAANNLKIQEFMLVPENFNSFSEATAAVTETYHELKKIIARKYGKLSTNVGDEGGFAPNLDSSEETLELLESAVSVAGYNKKISFAIDAAASEFYDKEGRVYGLDRNYSSSELIDYYMKLINSHDIVSLEDPFHQEDFDSFSELTARSRIQIVGDDLLVTNIERIKTAVAKKSCNCLLLKVNQIGTLTEAINAAKFAMASKWNIMVSHRSGETSDSFIADLAVALGCGQIKAGAPSRSDRTAKYNQLLRIEEELGKKAKYGDLL